jgi:hypothetical protein
MVKRCGKSAPREAQATRHGKPRRVQGQIGNRGAARSASAKAAGFGYRSLRQMILSVRKDADKIRLTALLKPKFPVGAEVTRLKLKGTISLNSEIERQPNPGISGNRPAPQSGAEARAVQTLARDSVRPDQREASGLRAIYRRFSGPLAVPETSHLRRSGLETPHVVSHTYFRHTAGSLKLPVRPTARMAIASKLVLSK